MTNESRPMGCFLCCCEPCRCDEMTEKDWENVAARHFDAILNTARIDLQKAGMEYGEALRAVRNATKVLIQAGDITGITSKKILQKVKEMKEGD